MSHHSNRESRGFSCLKWAALVTTTFLLLFDASGKLLTLSPVVEGTMRLGFGRHHVFWLGVVEAACALAFLVPRTALIGAVLLTAFLGGATATHVRIDEPFFFPIVAGAIVWTTLLLRSRDTYDLLRRALGGHAA